MVFPLISTYKKCRKVRDTRKVDMFLQPWKYSLEIDLWKIQVFNIWIVFVDFLKTEPKIVKF